MKTWLRALMLCVVCSFFPASVWAVSLTLVPSAPIINPGDPLTVDVDVSGLGNLSPDSLGAFSIEVTFDSNVLTFGSETYGAFLGDTNPLAFETDIFTTTGVGSVSLSEVSFLFDFELDALQPDTFTLATLSFSGNGVGTSLLDFGVVDLSDAAFPANTLNLDALTTASVTVQSATPPPTNPIPEPSTILLFGSGVIGVVLLRIRKQLGS